MIEKDRHNPELKKHVSDIFDFFKKMKFPEQLPKNPLLIKEKIQCRIAPTE
ncbi:MAG: hypothetical protein HWD61_00650 [Parachlamydiaceae bacterium]|nr:MAG: hypothetical protein HWD61_00650 [Parachlamydiaceae bacterium]